MARANRLAFTKSWRNAEDFPTYEDSETQVREDLQCLFDEIRDYLNETLLPAVNTIRAQEIAYGGGTVAAALAAVSARIETVRSELIGAALGEVPDGSFTAAKFAPGGAAGWTDVTAAVDIAADTRPDGSTVEAFSLQDRQFLYSASLGVMAYWLQLGVTTSAPAQLYLAQHNYHAPRAAIASRAGSVYLPRVSVGESANALIPGAAMCRRVPGSADSDETEYAVQLFAPRDGQVFVSGWYFCEGA